MIDQPGGAATDAPEQKASAELLFALRMEYARALHQEDYSHINKVILPRFLEHFGKYYNEYARDWKSLSLSRPSVRVITDPRQGEEILVEWADRVLGGHIDIEL